MKKKLHQLGRDGKTHVYVHRKGSVLNTWKVLTANINYDDFDFDSEADNALKSHKRYLKFNINTMRGEEVLKFKRIVYVIPVNKSHLSIMFIGDKAGHPSNERHAKSTSLMSLLKNKLVENIFWTPYGGFVGTSLICLLEARSLTFKWSELNFNLLSRLEIISFCN